MSRYAPVVLPPATPTIALMARKIDIGGYFEKMTKQARGGRRLDRAGSTSSTGPSRLDDAFETPTPGTSPSGSASRPGGLKDVLRDVLGKGRKTAERGATRVKETIERRTTTPTRELPPEGVVHVEYSPQEDGDPDPGEVVWSWVPFEEDPTQGKDRPVVIIGRRGRNLVGVPLTTKQNDREAQIDLGTGDWDPKRRTSYARIWRMLDVDETKTRREGATLDLDRFKQLIAAVDHYYDVKLPTPTRSSKASTPDYDY